MTRTEYTAGRRAMALLCVAQFMVVLDVTIVAIALPRIQRDLGFHLSALQWVISAYTLAFGGLLVPAGRAGDVYGHRRLLTGGLVLFSLASLACGLAWSASVLVAARTVQGAGAAMVAPAALAQLSAVFPAGAARRRAVAWWTASAAGGGAGGWMLGGTLAQGFGWRWVFLVNVPIGLAAALSARTVLGETARAARERLDVLGALAVIGGLTLLIYGTTLLPDRGLSTAVIATLAGAFILLAMFVVVERRAPRPLVPGLAVRSPSLRTAVLIAAVLTGTTTPAMYLAVLYQQKLLGLGALETGLRCAPFNVAVIAGSFAGPRLGARAGARTGMSAGLVLVAAGAVVLMRTGGTDAYGSVLLPAFTLMGVGLGIASVASTSSGTAVTSGGEHGVASGLLNAAAQLGSVLGLAVFVCVASARGGGAHPAGYHHAYTGAAAVAGAAAVWLLALRVRRPERTAGSLRGFSSQAGVERLGGGIVGARAHRARRLDDAEAGAGGGEVG